MNFDKAKNAVKTCLTICIILCVVSVITTTLDPGLSLIATLLSALLFILSFVIGYLYCRCPYCGKRIMLGMFKVKNCPKCSRNLATGAKVKSKKH